MDLKFEYGDAIPWFNRVGTANQVKSNINFRDLKVGVDYIIVEKMKFIDGNWVNVAH